MSGSLHRRFRRRGFQAVVVLVIGLFVLADHRELLLVRGRDDLRQYHGISARVVRVIDGDTFDVEIPDSLNARPVTRIALWGTNCPEGAHSGRVAEPFAELATAFAASRLSDRAVTLWLESHQTRDPFGRVLAHVELPDGTRINELLLEAGLAKADERWPHSMLTRYAQCEINARRRSSGLWSPDG